MELFRRHGVKLIFAYLLGFLLLSLLNAILMTEKMALLTMMVPMLSAILILTFYLLYYGGAANITISAIYKDESSISLFFKGVYRNFWKLFKVHFLILILAAIPVILIFIVSRGSFMGTWLFNIFDMIFSLIFYLLLLYLSFYTSILVIKDQLKAWPAIKKAFVSLKKDFNKIFIALLYTVGTQLFTAISLTGVFLIIFMLFNLDQINSQAMMMQLTYLGGMIFQSVFSFALVCGLPVFIKRYKDTIEPHFSQIPSEPDASKKD